MNGKQITGFITFIIGVALIVTAIVMRYRVEGAEMEISQGTENLPKAPVVGSVAKGIGGMLTTEAEEYRVPIRVLFIGGIVLAVVGAGLMFFGGNRKKR